MSPLRQRMITAMQMHGFSPRTHQSYLAAVEDLVRFTGQPPQALAPDQLRGYFEHLVTVRQLAPASVRLAYSGIRFLYCEVLGWPAVDLAVTLPARPQRIPELLTRAEVAAILAACARERDAMVLALTYACGLRLSEVVSLRVTDIDGDRRLLRVRQGKGAKDRLVPLSPSLLVQLRAYWRGHRPRHWLFPERLGQALSVTTVQKVYTTPPSAWPGCARTAASMPCGTPMRPRGLTRNAAPRRDGG